MNNLTPIKTCQSNFVSFMRLRRWQNFKDLLRVCFENVNISMYPQNNPYLSCCISWNSKFCANKKKIGSM